MSDLDLVSRLRGKYPVGPGNEFGTRTFVVPPLSLIAADRIEYLETAFGEMPCVDIGFNSKKERDDWREWTAKYFNHNRL